MDLSFKVEDMNEAASFFKVDISTIQSLLQEGAVTYQDLWYRLNPQKLINPNHNNKSTDHKNLLTKKQKPLTLEQRRAYIKKLHKRLKKKKKYS